MGAVLVSVHAVFRRPKGLIRVGNQTQKAERHP